MLKRNRQTGRCKAGRGGPGGDGGAGQRQVHFSSPSRVSPAPGRPDPAPGQLRTLRDPVNVKTKIPTLSTDISITKNVFTTCEITPLKINLSFFFREVRKKNQGNTLLQGLNHEIKT